MKSIGHLNFTVQQQGHPKVNSVSVIREAEDILVVSIDIASKQCEVSFISKQNEVPSVGLKGTSSMSNKHPDGKGDTTILSFEYIAGGDWMLFSAQHVNFTTRLCLIKRN
jgi:hypothetical protein